MTTPNQSASDDAEDFGPMTPVSTQPVCPKCSSPKTLHSRSFDCGTFVDPDKESKQLDETVNCLTRQRDQLRSELDGHKKMHEAYKSACDVKLNEMDALTSEVEKTTALFLLAQKLEKERRAEVEQLKAKNGRPLAGSRWRHSNGFIFCGTLRIARADFDTNPTPEQAARIFDDIVNRMNQGNE